MAADLSAVKKILASLKGVRERSHGQQWDALCPAHEDRRASLSVGVGADGEVLLKCQKGCSTDVIVGILGFTMADLWPATEADRGPAPARRRIVAAYDYRDETGQVLYQVIRYDPKGFAQRRPAGGGRWEWSLLGVRRVVYRLPELLAAPLSTPVYITEGEKDAEALGALGLVATTNAGGAGKWLAAYAEAFRGRPVVILPDNDQAGREHAQAVARALKAVVASLVIVELPGLAPKGDVSDWLAAGGTGEALARLAARHETNGHAPARPAEPDPVIPEPVPWPEPPRPEAYHGLAGDIVRLIEPETEADPAALLAQLLVGFGSVVGRGPYSLADRKSHHLNLYAILVGRTAKGRKGTSWAWVESLFAAAGQNDWLNDCVLSGLSSGEGLINAVRDPVRKKEILVDEGAKDKRILVVEEEFAGALRQTARDGNILSVILRQSWDGGKLRTLTRNNPLRATDAHVAIVGHVTKGELLRCLSENDQANGFANRFLWLCVRRSKLLPDGSQDLDLSAVATRLKYTLADAGLVGRMGRTTACQQLWRDEYARLSAEPPGLFGLVTNRAEAQVVRLSMVYALLDRSDSVGAEHLRAALAFWDYAERSCRYVFGESTGNKDADDLLEVLSQEEDKGLGLWDISNFFGRHKSSAEIGQILGLLQEHGLIRRERMATGGRPTERWFVSEGAKKAKKAKKEEPQGLAPKQACEERVRP